MAHASSVIGSESESVLDSVVNRWQAKPATPASTGADAAGAGGSPALASLSGGGAGSAAHAPRSEGAVVQLMAHWADGAATGGRGVAAASRGTSGPGQPLPFLAQIRRSFGLHDVSEIQAHWDEHAVQGTKALGAKAFAQGEHVAFAGAPDLRTAAHEAAHVVQQRSGIHLQGGIGTVGDIHEQHADAVAARVVAGESAQELLDQYAGHGAQAGAGSHHANGKQAGQDHQVQLLAKTDFPWHGVIVNTPSAALRSKPEKDAAHPHEGTIADLPEGTQVEVQDKSENWLEVDVELGGKELSGYVSQELVDDAVAHQMDGMLGQKAAWVPSGSASKNSFASWAKADKESEAPPLGPSTTLNCWEMVLYAAYKSGAIDWDFIHDLYVNQPEGSWISQMTGAGTQDYDPDKGGMTRGDLVFFDGLAHVALATGNKDEVYTFWPPPDFTSYTSGTVDKVKKSTVATLSQWMLTNFGKTPSVTFGAPAW